MNMKSVSSTRYSLTIAFLALITLIVVTYHFWQLHTKTYDIECDSYVSYRAINSYFEYDTTISIVLHDDNRGRFSIEGTLSKRDNSWNINRDVFFYYKKLPDNSVVISNFDIERYGRDNVPETLFRDTFLASDKNVGRVVTISKMMNGYLIGSLRAPVFFCASKKS